MKLGIFIIGTICAQAVTDSEEINDNVEYYDDDYYYDDYYNDTDYYYYDDDGTDAGLAGSIMARSGLNGANGNRPARPNRVKKPRPSKPPRTRPSRPPRTKRPKKTTTTVTTTTTTEEPTTTTTTTSTTTTTTSTTTTSTSTTTTTTTTSSSAFDLDYEALKLEAAALDLALEAPASGSKNNYAVDANYNNNNQQNNQQPNYQQQQYQQQNSQQYQQQNSQQNYNQGYDSYDQPKLSCWTCQASSYEECGQTGKLVACQPNQGSCFLEIRDRRDRYQQAYRQLQMGCKAVDACKNMHASNFRNGNPDYTECRPEAHYNHSVCRQCCYEDNCTKSPSWWEPTSREEWAYE